MANTVLPSKYAEALFGAAQASNSLNAVTEELKSIRNIIDINPELKKILFHPGIGKAEKKEMLKSLFGEKVSKLSLRLLMLLVEKKRERSEEHTSELQSRRDLHSCPTRRSSDLDRQGGKERNAQIALRRKSQQAIPAPAYAPC